MIAIANADHDSVMRLLSATPSLTTAALARPDEFFLDVRFAQVYEGDTALHVAAFSYDSEMARELIGRGADLRARNRRGAETASRCSDWRPWLADVESSAPERDHSLSGRVRR
jgi:ankyrin repeat protein